MKVDNFKFEKIVSSSLVMLSSGRLRFLNLGCDTGHLSFGMSCTFTVQVLSQLVFVEVSDEHQGLQERFSALAKRARRRSPRWRRTVAHRAPRVQDDSGRSPRWRRTVGRRARNAAARSEVTSPSCKRVASKSAGSTASPTPPVPQGTTASTTPPFVRAGYDCQNNTTVRSRPEAVGWAPLV